MDPTTRCKFRVTGVTTGVPGSPTMIKLDAVSPDEKLDGFKHSPEDHAFFAATPFGKIELSINNPYGAELFQPGEFVYADFTPAPNPYTQAPTEA